MKKLVAAALVAASFFAGTLVGPSGAGATDTRDVFHRVSGAGPIHNIVFRHHCIDAEDSASLLVLRVWDSVDHRAVLGCLG